MSIPTITSISPAIGPTGGKRVVRIEGTNFRLSPAPPASGRPGAVKPSVRVFFGTEEAREVAVLTTGKLNVLTPPAMYEPHAGPGAVDVTVKNVDQLGALIGAETATAVGGYTYARPNLNSHEGNESLLARMVRTLILKLRREILDNVELTVHTDYDDTPDGADIAMLSAMPGLVIVGPRLKENRFYSQNSARKRASGGRTFQQRPPMTVDLVFTLIGVDDGSSRLLNLQRETVSFFQRNKTIRMLRDVAVAGVYEEWEMDVEDASSWAGATNNSSIHVFNGTFLIRGFDIDDEDMGVSEIFRTTADGVILTGDPGVVPAAPIPADPKGPIEQIPPEE